MKLVLRCRKCSHRAETNEATFRSFVPPAMWEKLNKEKTILVATFEFQKECPNCCKGKAGQSSGKVFVTRMKSGKT